MSDRWVKAVRSQMVRGKNPLPRYHAYRREGKLTVSEQQKLTSEIVDQLQQRVLDLEARS